MRTVTLITAFFLLDAALFLIDAGPIMYSEEPVTGSTQGSKRAYFPQDRYRLTSGQKLSAGIIFTPAIFKST